MVADLAQYDGAGRNTGYVLPPGVCRADAEHAAVARISIPVREDIDEQTRAIRVALAGAGWAPSNAVASNGSVIVWTVVRRPIMQSIGRNHEA